MIKSIKFSAITLMALFAFAFTPVNEEVSVDEVAVDEMVAACCGYVKVESACISPAFPPLGATVTVTDPFGNVVLSVPANGYFPLQLLTPGSYEVSITSTTWCSVTIGWEFCNASNGGNTYTVTPTTPVNLGFTVFTMNC